MKTLYVSAFAAFFNSLLIAQPTLTGAQLNPVVGEKITISRGNYLSDGPNGSNQTWNFSSISATNTGTVNIIPTSSSYPGTNMGIDAGQGNVAYLQADATQQTYKYQNLGGALISFSNLQQYLALPLSASTNMNDAFAATFTLSGLNFSRYGTTTLQYEGFGTVITPAGTFTDCIKVKIVQSYTDTYIGGVLNYESTSHLWYKAGIHWPVLNLSEATQDVAPQNFYSQFYVSSVLSTEEMSLLSAKIYPNPAHDDLTISAENVSDQAPIQVYNMSGRLVLENNPSFVNGEAKINLSNLEAGCYFVQVQLSDGTLTRKKFQKI
jgi:hypothetical protein